MRVVCLPLLALCFLTAAGQAPRQSSSAEADEFLRSGTVARQHGDLKTAIEDFRKALAVQPGMVEARVSLGAAYAAAGQFDAAIEEDTRVLATVPEQSAARMNRAMAYYRKGDLSHARSELESIHAARPLDLSAAILLGYTYNKLGREADAAALLAPLEAGHESNMELEYVLAYALIQSDQATEGLPRMEKVARTKRSADAWVIAGSAHMSRREFRDARADLDAAVELDSSLPGLYTLAGQARYAVGDSDAAVSAFEAALRSNPRDFNANLYLGSIRLDERDLESARPLLELALQLQPATPLARLELAELNGMTGNPADAVKTLEDLEKTDPDWLDPHVALATLYYKLHRPEDGLRERQIVQQIEAREQKAGPRNK